MPFGINETANLKKLLLQRTLRNVETYKEINTVIYMVIIMEILPIDFNHLKILW